MASSGVDRDSVATLGMGGTGGRSGVRRVPPGGVAAAEPFTAGPPPVAL